jgi:hypothetical protein
MAEPPAPFEQTLHGYGHGHELLAASLSVDDATANLLSHNSDSAPSASVSDGPFLTGYPLPDGRYVIARTWADTVADRPNTVITLSVIIPVGANSSFSMQRLLEHLEGPPQPFHTRSLPPIDPAVFHGAPIQLSPEEAVIAAEFYARPRPLHARGRASRERIALAIWQQLWRSARYALQFCTAPDTDRFAKAKRPLRFQSLPTDPTPASPAACVTTDFEAPGPFREFVHFVGSGERAVGLMQPFARTYMMLTNGELTPDAFAQVLTDYKGDEPRRLRRLKRRVAGFQRGGPAWQIDPFDLLDAYATHDLGSMVYASDASLDRWLRTCWDIDPRRTVTTLGSVTGDLETPAGPPTAREGLVGVFAANAPDLITPNTVAIAVALHRDTVLRAIWASNNPALWAAWADLVPAIEVPYGDSIADFEWAAVLQAIRRHPIAISSVLRRYPEALDHLILLVEANPLAEDLILDLPGDAKRLIRYRLEHDADHLPGLARLADDRTVPRALQSEPWIRTVEKSKDEIVHAVGYLIARNAGTSASEVAVQTFARLHRTLKGDGGAAAWERLTAHLRGDRGSWDRCARLTDDFVHLIRSYSTGPRSDSVAALQAANPEAASAVERRIRSEVEKDARKKFRIWDPTTW